MQLLAAIIDEKSAPLLREIDPEVLLTLQEEKEAFRYLRRHFENHKVIPSHETLRDNTGIVLPNVEEPASYYMQRCRERALSNFVKEPYSRLQDALQNPRTTITLMDKAIDDLNRYRLRFLQAGSGIETSDHLLNEVRRQAHERRMAGDVLRGITTGFDELDRAMDGYNGGDLAVWVGRPGRSKSWLLLRQAHSAWMNGYRPMYISMEMGGIQNMRRLVGIHSGINPTFIKRGQIQTLARPNFERAIDELLEQNPLHMLTANFSRTVDQIANYAEEYKPHVIYIDAGYLLTPRKKRYGSSGRRETISDVIEELKELGANLGIPIVITVQFNREAERRRRSDSGGLNPIAHLSLAEIGETDVIGQTASHVFGIEYPPEPLPRDSHRVFGILKGREGESGWWLMKFMETQFSPVSLPLVPRTDPVYEMIAEYARQHGGNEGGRRNPRNVPPAERTALMRANSNA